MRRALDIFKMLAGILSRTRRTGRADEDAPKSAHARAARPRITAASRKNLAMVKGCLVLAVIRS